MKTILFTLLSFSLTLFSCQQNETDLQNKNEVKLIEVEKDGFNYVFKTKDSPYLTKSNSDFNSESTQQYYLSVSKDDKKIESIIVRKDIDDRSYVVYHYTIEEVLFATIFITNEQIADIKLEFDNAIQTKEFSSWYDCANREYKKYKVWYEENHPILCDVADLFFGACTVVGATQAGTRCLF